MRNRRFLAESVEKVTADHEMLAGYIESFNRIFATRPLRATREGMASARLFLNKHILDHFAYEERRVFPAILAAKPDNNVAQGIAELRAEHRLLRQQARQLGELLTDESQVLRHPGLLRKGMLRFFGALEKHAARESELFPSLL